LNFEIVANVSTPTLTAYLPDPSVANGTALIIAPGGGFHLLSIDNEGIDVAKWCVRQGIAAFVLKYRLVPTGDDAGAEFFQKLQDRERMDADMKPVIALAKADGLAAIEHVRRNADQYKVSPDRIGIVGFSAGGTIAAAAAFEYTSVGNRPDFSAPIYPALHVVNKDKMPDKPMPMFIAVTADDMFGFQTTSVDLFKQWNAANQPIELHIYQKGGHGFGMQKQNLPSDHWIETFAYWLDSHGWLKKN
jgi:acetyl esterase/lipase